MSEESNNKSLKYPSSAETENHDEVPVISHSVSIVKAGTTRRMHMSRQE